MSNKLFKSIVMLIACGIGAGAPSIPAAAQSLKIGVAGTSSDAPYFIADKKGFFKDEGLTVEFIRFDSAAKAIPSLASGELQIAGGATSAGLYNAMKRGIDIKIVADKARNSKGYGFSSMLVRKDLYDSGKVRSLKDFKGLRVAVSAPGNSESACVDGALKTSGLSWKDISPVYLGFAQHTAAFQNGAIDASLTTEPARSNILKLGTAVDVAKIDEVLPEFQTAVTFFSESFITKQRDVATKAMRALIRGMRFYNDALKDGKLAGPAADEVVAILVEYSFIKDPAIHRSITSHATHPDGDVDMPSLTSSWQFFKDTNQIDGSVRVEDVTDMSFAREAAASLGKYVRRTQ
ncbi:MAG: ABC transporter substrate-binding protein [Pseudorhodoplanes sp.]|uniref:ABC transporter substrate-binding protein n=1 Tax=Pseudorhodoplanes sp. TaxID=1934341 RepID=UPI003D121F0C